jgi:hypothetical protein
LRRLAFIGLALIAVVVVGCGLGDGGAGNSQKKAPKGTFDLPNGRSLYIARRGSGSPTLVLEPGENTPASAMAEV